MKISIDDKVLKQNGLSSSDFFILAAISEKPNILDEITLLKSGDYIIEKEDGSYIVRSKYKQLMTKILFDSDRSIPSTEECTELANSLRNIFPKGIKSGSAAWRGNTREIALRLQKFFKLYGNNWSNEEIEKAAKKYVESFNGDCTYMKILKYFILKAETRIDEEGNSYIEEVSQLANWLDIEDGDSNNSDWTSELK